MDGEGGETHDEGAHNVDFHLSLPDLLEWLGAAGRCLRTLNTILSHLLHVAFNVAVDLKVTDEQNDECNGVD